MADLRDKVDEAFAANRNTGDSQFAQSYGQFARVAAQLFPNDPAIGGLQVTVPPEIEALLGADSSGLTVWVRMQVSRLATRLSQLARREIGPGMTMEELDLSFMSDDELKYIAAQDFLEAQRCYHATAPKAAAVLAGGAIEAMLVDALMAAQQTLDWDRAGLKTLVEEARAAGLIRPSTAKLASSAKDFRDTVHPQAEKREQLRAGVREASILLSIVSLVASDLGSKNGSSDSVV